MAGGTVSRADLARGPAGEGPTPRAEEVKSDLEWTGSPTLGHEWAVRAIHCRPGAHLRTRVGGHAHTLTQWTHRSL